jgi:hypothetical protein
MLWTEGTIKIAGKERREGYGSSLTFSEEINETSIKYEKFNTLEKLEFLTISE